MNNKINSYAVTGILLVFSSYSLPLNADTFSELMIENDLPKITFHDPTYDLDTWIINANRSRFSIWNFNSFYPMIHIESTAKMQLNMLEAAFQIEAQNQGVIIASIDRHAPALSLDIQSDGDVSLAGGDVFIDTAQNRVGIGTTTPLTALEIESVIPQMYFDDTSADSTDWLMGNSENDFIFESVFQFPTFALTERIMTLDAPTGFVQIGPFSEPESPLHIKREDGLAKILVEDTNPVQSARDLFEIRNNGNPEFRMTNTGNSNSWSFSAGQRFVVKNNAGNWVSRITPAGNMEITGTLTTTGGTCGGGCDLVFDPNTEIETIEQHATLMWANSYLPAVGPTPENEPFNLTEKTGGMLNELEKAHIYIEQLHTHNQALEQRVQELERQNHRIEEMVLQIVSGQTQQVVSN